MTSFQLCQVLQQTGLSLLQLPTFNSSQVIEASERKQGGEGEKRGEREREEENIWAFFKMETSLMCGMDLPLGMDLPTMTFRKRLAVLALRSARPGNARRGSGTGHPWGRAQLLESPAKSLLTILP